MNQNSGSSARRVAAVWSLVRRAVFFLGRWALALVVCSNLLLTAMPWALSGSFVYGQECYPLVIVLDACIIALLVPVRPIGLRLRTMLASGLAVAGLLLWRFQGGG